MRKETALTSMVTGMVLWGFANPFSDISMSYMTPAEGYFLESVAGALAFIAIVALIPRLRKNVGQIPWRLAIPLGLIMPGLCFYLGNIGYQYGSVTTGVILMSSEVIFLALGGAVILREKLSPSSIVALAVGVMGSIIVGLAGATNNPETAGLTVNILGFTVSAGLVGAIAFLGTGLSGAIYGLFTRRLSPEINVISLTLGQVTTAVFMSTTILLITGTPIPNPGVNGTYFWAAVMGGLVGTTVPFFLFNYAAPHLTTKQTALTLNVIPVIAILFGALMGRGLPVGMQYLGIVLVFISLFALETKAEDPAESHG
jgi:drug/metabolite transporter (DMT)-like permease